MEVVGHVILRVPGCFIYCREGMGRDGTGWKDGMGWDEGRRMR